MSEPEIDTHPFKYKSETFTLDTTVSYPDCQVCGGSGKIRVPLAPPQRDGTWELKQCAACFNRQWRIE